jgi:hypothetical protein
MTMDTTEIALIRKTFESALSDAPVDAAGLLDDLGWWELREADPMVATAELFEAQGRLRRATSALDVIVAGAAGESLAPGTAVLHPGLGAWDRAPGRLDADSTVRFDGLVLVGLDRAARLVVPFDDGDGLGVATVELSGVRDVTVRSRAVGGFDPTLRLVAVTGSFGLSGSVGWPAPGSWRTLALAARRALAHELCGLAQAMLDQAAAYVTERHQFGRPIAAFQTVRHRLTEVYVALASARAALDGAWATGEPLLGDAAKALAGRAAQLAAKHCLQVTGAIGFTEEYDLAPRIRRVHLLDALYGGADALTAQIGGGLLATRSLPRLQPLP